MFIGRETHLSHWVDANMVVEECLSGKWFKPDSVTLEQALLYLVSNCIIFWSRGTPRDVGTLRYMTILALSCFICLFATFAPWHCCFVWLWPCKEPLTGLLLWSWHFFFYCRLVKSPSKVTDYPPTDVCNISDCDLCISRFAPLTRSWREIILLFTSVQSIN